jgi:hypothetical protein
VFGLLLGAIGLGAIYGMATVNVDEARVVEQRIQRVMEMEQGKIPIPVPDTTAPAGQGER